MYIRRDVMDGWVRPRCNEPLPDEEELLLFQRHDKTSSKSVPYGTVS